MRAKPGQQPKIYEEQMRELWLEVHNCLEKIRFDQYLLQIRHAQPNIVDDIKISTNSTKLNIMQDSMGQIYVVGRSGGGRSGTPTPRPTPPLP